METIRMNNFWVQVVLHLVQQRTIYTIDNARDAVV